MAKYAMFVSARKEIEELSTTAKSKIKAGGKVTVVWNKNYSHDNVFLCNLNFISSGFLRKLESFSLIFLLAMCQDLLSYTHPLSQALQSTTITLLKAYQSAQKVIKKIQDLRNDDKYFKNIYDKALNIAKHTNIQPSKLRVVGRQSYR